MNVLVWTSSYDVIKAYSTDKFIRNLCQTFPLFYNNLKTTEKGRAFYFEGKLGVKMGGPLIHGLCYGHERQRHKGTRPVKES